MCLLANGNLTKEYRNKTKPITAWKVVTVLKQNKKITVCSPFCAGKGYIWEKIFFLIL